MLNDLSTNNILTKQYFVQISYGNVESDYNTFQIIKKNSRCMNIVYKSCEKSQSSHCKTTPNSVR